jgi:hypothetical protein
MAELKAHTYLCWCESVHPVHNCTTISCKNCILCYRPNIFYSRVLTKTKLRYCTCCCLWGFARIVLFLCSTSSFVLRTNYGTPQSSSVSSSSQFYLFQIWIYSSALCSQHHTPFKKKKVVLILRCQCPRHQSFAWLLPRLVFAWGPVFDDATSYCYTLFQYYFFRALLW